MTMTTLLGLLLSAPQVQEVPRPAGTTPPTVQRVLALHERSLGDARLWRHRNLAVFGRYRRAGQRWRWRVYIRRDPFGYREEWIQENGGGKAAPATRSLVSDGRYAWEALPPAHGGHGGRGGRGALPPAAAARGVLDHAFIEGLLYLDRRRTIGRSGFDQTWKLRVHPGVPKELSSTPRVHALHFLSPGGMLLQFHFDTRSGRLLEIAEPDVSKLWIRFGRWRDFGGLSLPTLRVSGTLGQKTLGVYDIDRVETGVTHPQGRFAGRPLAPLETAKSGGSLRLSAASVPGSARLLLEGLRLNGASPMPAIVDTGADSLALSPGIAAALRLPPGGRFVVRTLHGKVERRYAWLDHFVLGDRIDAQLLGRVIELPAVSELPEDRQSGLLVGARELLAGSPLFDVAHGKLRWRGEAALSSPAPDEGVRVRFHWIHRKNGTFVIDLEVQGKRLRALVDTGLPVTLRLGAAALRRLGLPTTAKAWRARGALAVPAVGAGGGAPRSEWIARLDSLRIGKILFRRPLVQIGDLDLAKPPNASAAYQVILGCGALLALDRVGFDTARQNLALYPRDEIPRSDEGVWQVPPPPRFAGLMLSQGKVAPHSAVERLPRVDWVSEGGPAAKAGIRLGDRIVAVDGQSVEQVPLDRVHRRLWLADQARVRLELVDADGVRRVALLR